VKKTGESKLKTGELVSIKITDADVYDLKGEVIP